MSRYERVGDVWFTSDQHYGHTNIIRFCDRPFATIEEMDEALVARYNALVKPDDTVYHLGDFSFAKDPAGVFRRLRGRKFLILGNHDWGKRERALRQLGWGWVKDAHFLKLGRQPAERIWLSHYAHRVWPKSHHGSCHLHGHSHGDLPEWGRSTDVGVDAWDYAPVHLDTILARLKDREAVHHHG